MFSEDKGKLDDHLVINSPALCNWLRNILVSRQSLKSYTHAKGGEQWRGLGNLVKTDGRGTRIETITMTEDLGTFRLLFQKKFQCHRKTKQKMLPVEKRMLHILSSTCSIFHYFSCCNYAVVNFIYFQNCCLDCESSAAILICLQRENRGEQKDREWCGGRQAVPQMPGNPKEIFPDIFGTEESSQILNAETYHGYLRQKRKSICLD